MRTSPYLELLLIDALVSTFCTLQVPGAMMMNPYRAPKIDEEIIGYELYYRRVSM